MNINKLDSILQCVGMMLIWLILVFLCILCDMGVRKEKEEYNENVKYPFLEKEIAEYICVLSQSLDLDSDLVVAHLIAENPEFNVNAQHLNENGTTDLGLFQLNDRYLFTTFKDAYWQESLEIDPYDWRHNTYIAVHLMKDLQKKFENLDDAIMAYNGGSGAVKSGNIKPKTYEYLAKVKKNLAILKEE